MSDQIAKWLRGDLPQSGGWADVRKQGFADIHYLFLIGRPWEQPYDWGSVIEAFAALMGHMKGHATALLRIALSSQTSIPMGPLDAGLLLGCPMDELGPGFYVLASPALALPFQAEMHSVRVCWSEFEQKCPGSSIRLDLFRDQAEVEANEEYYTEVAVTWSKYHPR